MTDSNYSEFLDTVRERFQSIARQFPEYPDLELDNCLHVFKKIVSKETIWAYFSFTADCPDNEILKQALSKMMYECARGHRSLTLVEFSGTNSNLFVG